MSETMIYSPWTGLNDVLDGSYTSSVTVLAAARGPVLQSAAIQWARWLAERGIPTLYLRSGDDVDFTIETKLHQDGLPSYRTRVADVAGKIEQWAWRGVRVVFVDLRQIEPDEEWDSHISERNEVARHLRHAARAHDVTIIALRTFEHHPRRRPTIDDLGDDAEQEYVCDQIVLLDRPEEYAPDDFSTHGRIDFYVEKNRHGPSPVSGRGLWLENRKLIIDTPVTV